MERLVEKAEILMEALPFITKFRGKTFVIKYGGNAMAKADLKVAFAQDILMLKYIGINPVIVHGGGPQIGQMLKRMGLESKFVGGLRVTDRETMEVVEMVLGGLVNKSIVMLINRYAGGHIRAVGLTGKDGGLIRAKKLDAQEYFRQMGDFRPTELLDLGHVGEVEYIDTQILKHLEEDNYIPVIAPVGFDTEGNAYNINADFVASAVAGALKAEKVIFLTDIEGLKDEQGNTVSSINVERINRMIEEGVIKGGMIPKVKACIQALSQGVKKAHILDGRIPHCVLLEIFTSEGIGTEIVS
ncbi:MAG TPA: acetylglutamate kinase [Persephonella sp.]|uniref:Acetylglutamate kinase n=1 Tax=Persephonella marina (strain DSM 14350 / EX-H1) TaxID=123214 RepID=ARGB_PERMH|nr:MULTISPECIES: acetylglutamate kinase [Persephonella]C0QRI8.1 RecName: Full=Acetylglutamate kinase; AltName: Full=N-acetyl-L-glutamate 5-phosphotransferase; AltName: Full=NAG kinase; Short=NAGK [Persephonella marina EX-H1]ACO04464.1 acetylglutamate kinase [Persephonella marina EX-H1]HCB69029.1 acetylglutamate kinase [Persephonella sp.]